MSDYILSCSSTADLTKEHLLQRDIRYICFHYMLNGKHYYDDLGQTISYDDFYSAMKSDADTKTSQINVDEYIDYFSEFLNQGKDILHVNTSSGISGSYQSACIAASTLQSDYPDRKIYIVDSLGASSGYGLLMDKLADLRDDGLDIDSLYNWAESNRLNVHHWFFSTDLTYYIKGGRVSKTAGLFGTILNICPLLNMDKDGKLIPRKKLRGKSRAITEIVEKMKEYAVGGHCYSGKCYISHSACYEDAKAVADMVEAYFPNLNGKVEINNIGTTIGSHTGPGTVALFFWGDKRND